MAMLTDIPIQPDVEALRRLIVNREPQQRVHFAELFQDRPIQEEIARRYDIDMGGPPGDPVAELKFQIRLQSFLGYDMVRAQPRLDWPFIRHEAEDTADETGTGSKKRGWQDEHTGPISSWEDFEAFTWPDPKNYDFSIFEWAEKNVPDGMGVYTLTSHILEWASWLMGYENLCLKLYDDPDLVGAVFQRVGEISEAYTRNVVDFDCVKVIWGSDDMGFKGGTMIGPDDLRTYALPWHALAARLAHEKGKMYWLHACGNLKDIMPDLIDVCRIDAKHSWEDAFLPVEEAYEHYGSSIGIIGGIDVDFLCRADETAIRRRVRKIVEQTAQRGGYCLGSGNSVTNYVPVDNYLIMLDEGRRALSGNA